MVAQALHQTDDETEAGGYDASGVDRSLIREMLALEPEARLRRVEAMVEDILQIWELNGTRPVR